LSTYKRRSFNSPEPQAAASGTEIKPVQAVSVAKGQNRGSLESWRGRGVAGGWDCVLDSDCSFLSQGPERGWRFSGDESFDTTAPDAGIALGVVVEGKRSGRRPHDGDGSRL
jgi:hypothetical protein